jgi:hypothetical protein
VDRGTGLERPEDGGDKTCRLAVGSADMLWLAGVDVAVYQWQSAGHAALGCVLVVVVVLNMCRLLPAFTQPWQPDAEH